MFGLAVGALLTLTIASLLLRLQPCSGLTLRGFLPIDMWQCSAVGRYRLISGVWIDGFEEHRFFAGASSLPAGDLPEANASLQIDEAARDLIERGLPPPIRRMRYQAIVLSFYGNELEPLGQTGAGNRIRRVFVVRQVRSARLIRRIYV